MKPGNSKIVKKYSEQRIHNKENFQLSRFYSDLEKIESSLHTSKSKTKVSRNSSQHSLSKTNAASIHNSCSLGRSNIENIYNYRNKPSINNSSLKKQTHGTKYAFYKQEKTRLNLQERDIDKNLQSGFNKNKNSYLKFQKQQLQEENAYLGKFERTMKTSNSNQKKSLFDSQTTSKVGEQNWSQKYFEQITHNLPKNQFSRSTQQYHSNSYKQSEPKSSHLKSNYFQTHQANFRDFQKQKDILRSDENQHKIEFSANESTNGQNENDITVKIMNQISLRDNIYETVVQGMRRVYLDEERDKKEDFRLKQTVQQQEQLSYIFERERMLSKMVQQFKKMCGIENYNLNQLHTFLFENKDNSQKLSAQDLQEKQKDQWSLI